jgi:hypothetical protein
MSNINKPVTLPKDFYSTWAEPSQARNRQAYVSDDNPFSDSGAISRVTASGYTNSTLGPQKCESRFDMGKSIDKAIEETRRYPANPIKGTEKSISEVDRPDLTELRRYSNDFDELERLNYLSMDEPDRNKKSSVIHDRQWKGRGRAIEDEWKEEVKDRYVTMNDFTQFAKSISTIHPRDSASVVPLSNQNDMRMSKVPGSRLSGIREIDTDVEGTVIGGYDMSAEEKLREIDSFNAIPSIRGLPRVYVNERLNFLSHIHTALFRFVTSDSGNYPDPDCLSRLIDSRKSWGSDPETMLLKVVLTRTIDIDSSIVIANPFKLPIIEPTMEVTTQLMYMCLDQLHHEFETEYFNTVKTMTTPDFHNKYHSRKYRSRNSGKRRNSNTQVLSSSSSSRSTKSSSGSRRSSVNESGSFLSRVSGW